MASGEQVAPRVAGAENVRAALALVARGEARFGTSMTPTPARSRASAWSADSRGVPPADPLSGRADSEHGASGRSRLSFSPISAARPRPHLRGGGPSRSSLIPIRRVNRWRSAIHPLRWTGPPARRDSAGHPTSTVPRNECLVFFSCPPALPSVPQRGLSSCAASTRAAHGALLHVAVELTLFDDWSCRREHAASARAEGAWMIGLYARKDEALAALCRAASGEASTRLYGWSRPMDRRELYERRRRRTRETSRSAVSPAPKSEPQRPCSQTAAQAASKAGMPCARCAPTRPASTSPEPAVANPPARRPRPRPPFRRARRSLCGGP